MPSFGRLLPIRWPPSCCSSGFYDQTRKDLRRGGSNIKNLNPVVTDDNWYKYTQSCYYSRCYARVMAARPEWHGAYPSTDDRFRLKTGKSS